MAKYQPKHAGVPLEEQRAYRKVMGERLDNLLEQWHQQHLSGSTGIALYFTRHGVAQAPEKYREIDNPVDK